MTKQQHITSIDDDADDEFLDGDTAIPAQVSPAAPARSKRNGNGKETQTFSLPGACGDTKIINIHHGEGKLGASAAFVAVNGHAFHIPRGVKVCVPVEIVAAIDTAINIVYEQVDKAMVAREVRRFPYSEYVS